MKIYLAGKVAKGDEIGCIENWRIQYKTVLNEHSKETLCFFDPDVAELDESDFMEIAGHDFYLIKNCDFIIVNAEKKIGVGTAQEMVVAKYYKKYVVAVIPHNSYYCRENLNMYGNIIKKWMHPFMKTFSDEIVENVYELGLNIEKIKETINSGNIKDITIIDKTCDYFSLLK